MNHYSPWRYVLIVGLIVWGVIYALPNFYGTDPALQIQTKTGSALPAAQRQKIDILLTEQNLKPLHSTEQTSGLLLRFRDTETQLQAQRYIQALLGEDVTVALNLAPRTPHWLHALGAEPMKLGLDLRGGIHFLYRVDVNAMLQEQLNSDMRAMADAMREKTIRYTHIALLPEGSASNDGVVIAFRDDAARDKAMSLLQHRGFAAYLFVAYQQNDRFFIRAVMQRESAVALEQQAISQNLMTLRNRVNALGVSEPVIQQQGHDQISVDLPGIQDTARAKDIIGKVATVRLQLVDLTHDPMGPVPVGDTRYEFEGRPYLLKDEIVLHGRSILSATTITDDNGKPAVSIRAGGAEVTNFNQITADNIGQPMATLYVETKMVSHMMNGKPVTTDQQFPRIINIATINNALGNSFQIMGLDSDYQAKNLALLLRSGAYSVPIAAVSERTIGPSLGQENIRTGTLACELGLLFVAVFMLLYYRLFGLLANFALFLNVVFIVAIMSALGATLTLPGIAAIVLTVGMAVDANVLINERIREELRAGVSPQASITAGYDRAFVTIVDANVTTLIVALILFALGTGSVQGFAVTLIIGLLTSMVTAIFFTRAAVNLIYGKKRTPRLSLGITY